MKTILIFLILIVLLVSGCTQISSIICKPNWVKLPFLFTENTLKSASMNSFDEACKAACFNNYKVTTYKLESGTQIMDFGITFTGYYCYCDVNNCNP